MCEWSIQFNLCIVYSEHCGGGWLPGIVIVQWLLNLVFDFWQLPSCFLLVCPRMIDVFRFPDVPGNQPLLYIITLKPLYGVMYCM